MNDPAVVVWIVACALVVLAGLVLFHRRRRQEVTSETQHVRSEMHNTQIHAIQEWLTQERIVRVILQTRTAGLLGLQQTLNEITAMPAADVAATAAILLRHRDVRRACATFMAAKYALPHHQVMKELAEWAAPAKKVLDGPQPAREAQPA